MLKVLYYNWYRLEVFYSYLFEFYLRTTLASVKLSFAVYAFVYQSKQAIHLIGAGLVFIL